jgi:hypothetical protein
VELDAVARGELRRDRGVGLLDVRDKFLTIVVKDPSGWTLWSYVDHKPDPEEMLVYAIGVATEPNVGIWVKPEVISMTGDRSVVPENPLVELIPWSAIKALSAADQRPKDLVGFRPRKSEPS